jgi:tellurite resistance protein TerC
MRAIPIIVGASLLHRFHFLLYLFCGFLIITGIRMAFQKEEGIHPERNPVVRLFRRFMPVTSDFRGHHFFVRENGRRYATPLFITLLMIEVSDLVFATDSIPAIFAVTDDPFIVYTSNVFAILGLRSLYFALSGIIGLFHYLKYGLALILVVVGTKMVIADGYKVPIGIALGLVAVILAVSVVGSILRPPKVAEARPEGE